MTLAFARGARAPVTIGRVPDGPTSAAFASDSLWLAYADESQGDVRLERFVLE